MEIDGTKRDLENISGRRAGPYECGVGQPPMNCNICGGRVPGECCDRHQREPGYIALRDKYSRLFVIRTPLPAPPHPLQMEAGR